MLGNNFSQVRKLLFENIARPSFLLQVHCQGWQQPYPSNPVRTFPLSYIYMSFADVLNPSRPSQNPYATRRWLTKAPNVRTPCHIAIACFSTPAFPDSLKSSQSPGPILQ
jgi:hypothetical protein